MPYRVMLCMHFGLAARREMKKDGSEKIFEGVMKVSS